MASTKIKSRPPEKTRPAAKAKPPQGKDEAPEKETPETPDSPLLDMSDAAVRKMIKLAKKRGYVTYENLNAVLPSEEVTSEQIEDILSMLNEMGINVVEQEEAETEENQPEEPREEPEEDEPEGELVEVARTTPAKTEKAEPAERTDDPVRMYLREMGSVELLSREGEIAIAKRIEAGREAMIAGLCESPLTFQAIIIWRDELNEGKVFLRDIIDLEATYAGPDAKAIPGAAVAAAAVNPGAVAAPDPVAIAGQAADPPVAVVAGDPPPAAVAAPVAAPPAAPVGPTPFQAVPGANGHGPNGHGANGDGTEAGEEAAIADSDLDDDDLENSLSLAAIEAELKPKVLDTFDKVADTYKRLRRLQDQDIANRLRSQSPLTPSQERKYKKLTDELVAEVKSLRLNQARIDSLVEQLYDINK
ncbi:MAG TPA: RNA polymerase sigma factor region1.1 domain-containing protein, partial [Xanthobacteraceae bacterium]|nr:RNA polymerase sigma factor region1.1 domain-containing protein [Xanthobacteraceae bacterium]